MEVADTRPYIRFEQGDIETVLTAYNEYLLLRFGDRSLTDEEQKAVSKEKRHLRKIVKQSGGLLICRHSFGGLAEVVTVHLDGTRTVDFNPAVSFELRPDRAVSTRNPRWHFHPSGLLGHSEEELNAMSPDELRQVERNFFRRLRADGLWPYLPINNPHRCRWCGETFGSESVRGSHRYRTEAGKMKCRTRAWMVDRHWRQNEDGIWQKPLAKSSIHPAEFMQKHIARRHGVNDEELHQEQKKAKYVFLSGDEHASRLDMHGLSIRRALTCRRFYGGLEGCIKADAMLSAVLFEDPEDAAVFSYPSVTLWDNEDAGFWADVFLRNRPRDVVLEVVLVCDADWFTNPLVLTQALLCRSHWRAMGFDVCIAAPANCDFKGRHAECVPGEKCKQNGADDFLASGGRLDELVVLHREAPVYEHLQLEKTRNAQAWENMLAMLRALAEHADNDGWFEGSIEKLGRIAGLKRRTAYNVITYLVEDRIITVDRPMLLKREKWVAPLRRHVAELDWEDRPRFRLPEHLRAEPFQFFPLREWGGSKVADDLEPSAAPRPASTEVFPSFGESQARTTGAREGEQSLSVEGESGSTPLGSPSETCTNGKTRLFTPLKVFTADPTPTKEATR